MAVACDVWVPCKLFVAACAGDPQAALLDGAEDSCESAADDTATPLSARSGSLRLFATASHVLWLGMNALQSTPKRSGKQNNNKVVLLLLLVV